MTKPTFMPSPRPRPRTSPEDARQLASATGDLGFTRASNAPEDTAAKPKRPRAQDPKTPSALQGRASGDTVSRVKGPDKGLEAIAPEPAPHEPPRVPPRGSSLKFEVPDQVWVSLRQEALNRRVTVRYLVLEALAAKGYGVDLSTVPEDGRRLR